MRMFKGYLIDLCKKLEKLEKKNIKRFVVFSIESKGSESMNDDWYMELIDKFPESNILTEEFKRIPGCVYKRDYILFVVSQLLHGESKHYDNEEGRLKLFQECLDNIPKYFDDHDGKKEIALNYSIGSYSKEDWLKRKKILKKFEKDTGIEVLVFVSPIDIEIASKN